MFIVLPVEWFADSSLQIFGRHQRLEDCFFVSFDAFLVVVFVHQHSLVVAFGGSKTRLKWLEYGVYFEQKKCIKFEAYIMKLSINCLTWISLHFLRFCQTGSLIGVSTSSVMYSCLLASSTSLSAHSRYTSKHLARIASILKLLNVYYT